MALSPERLCLVVGAPRSGTTLLTRMLAAHRDVRAVPEPHLLTPLAHLGIPDRVDRAPYDAIQGAQALRGFVGALPGGERDWYDALRLAALHLYGQAAGDARIFVDKTPAYALVAPFLERLLPDARYVVLTRHPGAVHDSYVRSFFEGRDADAVAFNPILRRYVPAIAGLLRRRAVPLLHVRYEALVAAPEAELLRIQDFLGLSPDASAVEYRRADVAPGLGDPVAVDRKARPDADGVDAWRGSLASRPGAVDVLRAELDALHPDDLALWDTTPAALRAELDALAPAPRSAIPWDRGRAQRWLLARLRHRIDERPHGALVRRVRDAADVLLRGGAGGFRDAPSENRDDAKAPGGTGGFRDAPPAGEDER